MAKISTQVRYDENLYEKVKIIAENELQSINAQIEYFIKKGVESYEVEYGVISLPNKN